MAPPDADSDDSDDEPWRSEGQVLPNFTSLSTHPSSTASRRSAASYKHSRTHTCTALCVATPRQESLHPASVKCALHRRAPRTQSYSSMHLTESDIEDHHTCACWYSLTGHTRHHTHLWAPYTTSNLGATMPHTDPQCIKLMQLIGWGKHLPTEQSRCYALPHCRLFILGLPGNRKRH